MKSNCNMRHNFKLCVFSQGKAATHRPRGGKEKRTNKKRVMKTEKGGGGAGALRRIPFFVRCEVSGI